MSALRKIKRVGKKASKFHYSATYVSILIECHSEKWTPHMIQVAWHRRGRRIVSQILPWLPAPDTPLRGMVVWPEPEVAEASITLYKGPKDKSYEHKDWEFSVIDVDRDGQRKVLATSSIDMVRYASALPYEHELQLKLKPVSRKIKKILLELSLSSVLLKEGKATDDDMISLASMMSVSNLSMIGNLEDDDEDFSIRRFNGRSISPEIINAAVPSTDKLIDWAQEVTAGYSGVKIINMTTSWRNGLAFCALIHYYRPDLLDFDHLSPNSIKENNRMAFDISQELGIACPLTPDMMLLRDIPDKLAVTAFVYQMYNYFTMSVLSVPSAIIKPTGAPPTHSKPLEGGLTSFDFTEIEKLTCGNLSPTVNDSALPSQRNLRSNKFSKHSLKEEQEQLVTQQACNHDDQVGIVHTPEKTEPVTNRCEPISHSTPVSVVSGGMSAVDQVVAGSDCTSTSSTSNSLSDVSSLSNRGSLTGVVSPRAGLDDTSSDILPRNNTQSNDNPSPSVSLTTANRNDLSLPLSVNGSSKSSPSGSPAGTPSKESSSKDKSLSNGLASSPIEQKKEYYRKQAKEMMAKAGIKSDMSTFDAFTSRARKKLQEARKNSQSHSLRSVESSPSLPIRAVGDERGEQTGQTDSQLESMVVKSETHVDSTRNEDFDQSGQTSSVDSSYNESQEVFKEKKVNSKGDLNKPAPRKNKSVSDLGKNTRSNSSSLVIQPPEPPERRRSSAAKKMAEEPPPVELATEETDEPVKQEDLNEGKRPDNVQLKSRHGSMTSSTESPSAWTSHNNDLAEAILVTTSEYIKNELRLIQKDLKPLEERAATVENEIRESMALGDSSREELLTVEYFKLLNEKNALVKKQIELNLLEKEEDLQKRQFFINRELRPLAAIPDNQKSEQQKVREQQLIQELLELMDEREKLDKILTKTPSSNSAAVESSTVFTSPDNTSDFSQTSSFSASIKSKFSRNQSTSSQRGDNKDCVIS